MGAAEKLTQQQALEAITINAAHTIGIADITGSLRAAGGQTLLFWTTTP